METFKHTRTCEESDISFTEPTKVAQPCPTEQPGDVGQDENNVELLNLLAEG